MRPSSHFAPHRRPAFRPLAVVILVAAVWAMAPAVAGQTPPEVPPVVNPFGLSGLAPSTFLSKPAVVDLDSDGDLDVLSGMDNGTFAYFENTAGPGATPAFGPLQTQPFGLTGVGPTSTPSVADLDGDGDLDVVSGQTFNSVNPPLVYFENAAAAGATPAFLPPQFNPFGMVSLGNSTAPAVADLDGDGDLDVLTGNFAGSFVFYENTAGPGATPSFAWAQIDPFGLSDIGLASAPSVADLDGDGDPDLITGSASGGFVYFENAARPGAPPRFRARRGRAIGLQAIGPFSAPSVADLDGDGVLDVLAGEESGDFVFISGVGARAKAARSTVANSAEVRRGVELSAVSPNPSSGVSRLALSLPQPEYVRATVTDALGRDLAVLADGELMGTAELTVDTARLAAGVYVVRVGGESFAETRRLTVTR